MNYPITMNFEARLDENDPEVVRRKEEIMRYAADLDPEHMSKDERAVLEKMIDGLYEAVTKAIVLERVE